MPRFLFCLLLCAACTAAAAAARAAVPLSQLEARYHAHLLAARPDLASRVGLGGEDRLEPVSEATVPRDAALLRSLLATLEGVDRAALGPREAARLDTLRARVARENVPYANGAWTSDALAYLPLVRDAILDVNRAPRVTPCERARRTQRRLAMVPEVLRAARINLRAADRSALASAVPAWRAVADTLQVAIFKPLEGCKDPRRQADLTATDTLAVHAVRDFADALAHAAAEPPR